MTDTSQLDADQIIDTAIDIFRESGLDAVSMRSVAARLGVSPIPVYSRIGNKDALVAAIADRMLLDVAPAPKRRDRWDAYTRRWAWALLTRLRETRDSRLILQPTRASYVEASRPLVDVLRDGGFEPDAAVQACRLVIWATVGFAAVEAGATPATPGRAGARRRPGGDPTGIDAEDIDELFDLHIGYVIDGIGRN